MLTVLESIQKSTAYLEKRGIEQARINAEMLLAEILGCRRLDLYLKFDRPLDREETDRYRDFIKRRGTREPLQYILGTVEFYGMEFKVNPSVLIPRPETEIVVEFALKEIPDGEELRILDVGTGSGILAVTIAKQKGASKVTGIDISQEALKTAAENAKLNGQEGRIKFIEADGLKLTEWKPDYWDVIISNPPYVSAEEYPSLQPELTEYEPKEALTDNGDGLTFYRSITEASKKILKPGGKLFFELGKGQAEAVRRIMEESGFKEIRTGKDYLNIERVITGEKI